MKFRTTYLFTLLVLFFVACDQSDQMVSPSSSDELSVAQTEEQAARPDHTPIPGRFIVTLQPNENPADVAGEYGIEPDFEYHHVTTGFAGSISDAAKEGLMRDHRVVRVEQDMVVTVATTIQEGATWGLDRIDQRELPLDGNYHYTNDGSGVTAYVIDTGIYYSHDEFSGRIDQNVFFDAFDDGQDGNDCDGHGTHVAGTLGGTIFGVAKNVELVSVRVLDCDGFGSISSVIAGMDWVTGQASGPSVANLSLGGGESSAIDNAVETMYNQGIPVIVAAGNGNRGGVGQDACRDSPAGADRAYTVGATDDTDSRPRWSNFGDCVDIFAPGVSIKSAWHTNISTNILSGTSMATPHVAGVAALYLQNNPNASAQEVYDAISEASTKNIVSNSRTDNNHLVYSFFDEPENGDPENEPPTAVITFDCSGLECEFDGSDSFDNDGTIESYEWAFGDGNTASGETVTHTYSSGGTYEVTLTVTDNDGATDTATENVTVEDDNGGVGDNEPAIDTFEVSTRTTGPWFRATVNWTVSDNDGDLESVVVEMIDGSSVEDSQTVNVSGFSASGETELRTRGNADSVCLTVTDSKDNTATECKVF